MYCPDCGTADQAGESYCRQCGEWLSPKGSRAGKPEDKMTAMAFFNAISAVSALFSAVALYATYLGTDEAKWSVYFAAAFCTVIAVHQSVAFTYALQLWLRHKRGRAPAPHVEAPTMEQPLLAEPPSGASFAGFDVASVTEHTTDPLPPLHKVNQRQRSSQS